MKLYSFFNSSASYRVRIALALKGIDYEISGVNIRSGEQRDPAFLALSPAGLVPVLVDADIGSVTQSLAITDYLDRHYPQNRLLPEDERQRARVLEIVYTIGCDIHPLNNLRVLRYLSTTLQVSDKQKQDWYEHWVAEGLTAVETLLAKADSGDFCVGNAPTLADCCLIPQIANALRMKCDLSAYPRCKRVYDRCLTLPAFVQASPEFQHDFIAA